MCAWYSRLASEFWFSYLYSFSPVIYCLHHINFSPRGDLADSGWVEPNGPWGTAGVVEVMRGTRPPDITEIVGVCGTKLDGDWGAVVSEVNPVEITESCKVQSLFIFAHQSYEPVTRRNQACPVAVHFLYKHHWPAWGLRDCAGWVVHLHMLSSEFQNH